MTIRNLLIGAGAASLVVGASALGGAFGDRDARAESPPPRATPVAVQVLERQTSYEFERYFTGQVVARRTSDLGFERGGKIASVVVEEGQAVRAGAVIAHLDTTLLSAQQTSARAGVAAARAQQDELIAGARPFVMEQARALVKEREAELAEVVLRHARVARLMEDEVASQSDFDEVDQQKAAASARLTAAKQALAELDAGTREEQLAEQAAKVARQLALVAELEIELENSTLLAPYDGTVSVREVDEGTIVAAGAMVVRLVEDVVPEARIGVPLAVAGDFEVGEAVSVWIGPRREAAEVVSVSPELDPTTRTVRLSVRLNQSAVPGEVVRLIVHETVEAEGFWVPISALTRSTYGLWSCYAVDGEGENARVSRHAVEVISTDGERAYVRGSLQEGVRIVRSGTDRVVRRPAGRDRGPD